MLLTVSTPNRQGSQRDFVQSIRKTRLCQQLVCWLIVASFASKRTNKHNN